MIKVIFEKNDTLLSAYNKIKTGASEWDILVLDLTKATFPLDQHFFRYIQENYGDKRISIISTDSKVCKIAESVGMKTTFKDERLSFNTQYAKTHILKHNFTFLEYLFYEMKRFFAYLFFLVTEKRNLPQYASMNRYRNSNFILVISGLIISCTLLLFIFYFTVSRTYVYITPEITVKSIPANVVLTQNQTLQIDAKNIVRTRTVSIPVEHKATFRVQQIDLNSTQNAQWKITLYNELPSEQTFRPDTRFVTDDGIVYRSDSWIRLPGKRTKDGVVTLGTADVIVTADPYDTAGNIIGERWNIAEGTTLTMPWLKFNREYVYAKTREQFTGGENPKVHVVTQDELKKFESIMREQLRKVAYDTLEAELKQKNKDAWEDYAVFGGDTIVFTGDVVQVLDGVKIGDKRDEVMYEAKALVQGLVYDRKQTLAYLSQSLHERMLYGTEKELWMDVNSLRISNVIGRTDQYIKVTAEVNVNMTYDFENASNNLTRKLKSMIANTTEKEAISRLVSDQNIAKVRISFSPFWLTRVSSNPDNIEFIIEQIK